MLIAFKLRVKQKNQSLDYHHQQTHCSWDVITQVQINMRFWPCQQPDMSSDQSTWQSQCLWSEGFYYVSFLPPRLHTICLLDMTSACAVLCFQRFHSRSLLFLIYMEELSNIVSNFSCHFCDDTHLHTSVPQSTLDQAFKTNLKQCTNALGDWKTSN